MSTRGDERGRKRPAATDATAGDDARSEAAAGPISQFHKVGAWLQKKPKAGSGAPTATSQAGKLDAWLGSAPVQRRVAERAADPATDGAAIQTAAEAGIASAGTHLPHGDAIQRAFGRHDVSGVEAHLGGTASQAARAMGAEAFATGQHVAFDGTPSLHTAAHEAAHVVQQRAGVQLKGGVGEVGDRYEQHADAVADRVVRGESAEALLDELAPDPASAGGARAVQRVVLSKIVDTNGGGTKTQYYSTLDPDKEAFDDKAKAEERDEEMQKTNGVSFDPKSRVPTNFTYYNTPAGNLMQTKPQGPHTVSHSSLANRLEKRMNDSDHTYLRDMQVVDPATFKTLLNGEKPAGMSEEQQARMLSDYQLQYEALQKVLEDAGAEPEDYQKSQIHELMMRLIQMNPYSAYGKGKTTAKAHIKNKGERSTDKFEKGRDKGAKFNHPDEYQKFLSTRKDLFASDEESEDDAQAAGDGPSSSSSSGSKAKDDGPGSGRGRQREQSQSPKRRRRDSRSRSPRRRRGDDAADASASGSSDSSGGVNGSGGSDSSANASASGKPGSNGSNANGTGPSGGRRSPRRRSRGW